MLSVAGIGGLAVSGRHGSVTSAMRSRVNERADGCAERRACRAQFTYLHNDAVWSQFTERAPSKWTGEYHVQLTLLQYFFSLSFCHTTSHIF